ncbi:beta-ketoacyl synthase chain length factor [Algoriphagus sp. AGSA1]|uniref:beta-ketoacyl synthase chain length factor n=1 Tax=Algoriphagus sp. AGSA1 TaxID=2907213 RepID=UPI001F408222|nr:beta-ketoacyl synthase chain length factor [Algoriphagus sp. AGSA1]MCE7056461.1 beta-ketoacyl synthase chain length factor [Algoriphagus sp. AGSA1]
MNRLYIRQAVSISAQGFWEGFSLQDLRDDLLGFKAADADYKTVIPASPLRRMSKITKMSLLCGLSISRDPAVDWDAIIVGTGLGNLADTEKFLMNSLSQTGLVSPTAFTQSSHNTLSGQLALQLKNHGYNMTHVQRNFSFENALKDAALQFKFGANNILLGAADEHIPLLDSLAKDAGYSDEEISVFGEGASFFHLGEERSSNVFVQDISSQSSANNPLNALDEFLHKNQVDKDCCLVISTGDKLHGTTMQQRSMTSLAGKYMTSSGLAMHLGCSFLAKKEFRQVVIVNNSSTKGLGLILLSHE